MTLATSNIVDHKPLRINLSQYTCILTGGTWIPSLLEDPPCLNDTPETVLLLDSFLSFLSPEHRLKCHDSRLEEILDN